MEIKFSTENQLALDNFPPVPAKQFMPEWYKNTKLLVDKEGVSAKYLTENDMPTPFTVKGCIPIKDYMESGYVIRAHTDLLLTPFQLDDGTHSWWWKAKFECVGSHTFKQCPVEIGKGKNTYIKFMNPWSIRTPPGYSCLFYQHEYFFNKKLRFLPAIVDTDLYDSPVHFPSVVLSEETFMIKCGDPIMIVFPFKRENWSSKVLFQESKVSKLHIYLMRGYLKLFHSRKFYK